MVCVATAELLWRMYSAVAASNECCTLCRVPSSAVGYCTGWSVSEMHKLTQFRNSIQESAPIPIPITSCDFISISATSSPL
jgi:hypothetical protein